MKSLMHAAIRLYHIREDEDFNRLIAINRKETLPTIRRGSSNGTKIWFWAKKRWGIDFINEEYKIRESQKL